MGVAMPGSAGAARRAGAPAAATALGAASCPQVYPLTCIHTPCCRAVNNSLDLIAEHVPCLDRMQLRRESRHCSVSGGGGEGGGGCKAEWKELGGGTLHTALPK